MSDDVRELTAAERKGVRDFFALLGRRGLGSDYQVDAIAAYGDARAKADRESLDTLRIVMIGATATLDRAAEMGVSNAGRMRDLVRNTLRDTKSAGEICKHCDEPMDGRLCPMRSDDYNHLPCEAKPAGGT